MEPFVYTLVLPYLTCPGSELAFSLGDEQWETRAAQSGLTSLSLESSLLDLDSTSRTQEGQPVECCYCLHLGSTEEPQWQLRMQRLQG